MAEDEQALVPEHGELLRVAGAARFVRVREADEVEDEGVDDFVWQRVLLVEQHANEERVRAWGFENRRQWVYAFAGGEGTVPE